ncbi:hypothetical protein IFT84_13060 [Rhizobium sp. CFBP 8762]|uniref:hypothetical protein n=1 Tax=Rhizobium sp. CFBP 8762 TaxID=2775279 RepID=UPI001783CCC9|nr:hypothetical protein [Rhizobium sp. CFBP 8762]MBD8555434.1 hypothetical protein [Rhizobium sp. CFBP 8762]
MFNLSQIMKSAWAHYRNIHERYSPIQFKRGLIDGSFSRCLRIAWREAKEAVEAAAKAAKLAIIMAGPRGNTLRDLQAALIEVQYLSFRYRATDRRAALEQEIETLISQAA